jgi:uncharacterized FAD-dependent dehydrogenase
VRYLISNLPLELDAREEDLAGLLARHLGGGPADFRNPRLERRSLDARHKGSIRFLAAIAFECGLELKEASLPPGCRLDEAPEPPRFDVAPVPRKPRVVVVGSGPAGTFCALRLLDYGLEATVLERGPEMAERVQAVGRLWTEGILRTDANAQFGEGGAGTFSDGKLTTRIGHPATRYVIDTFVRFGAHPRIAYLAKPHVGTDAIRRCSVLIRKDAERRGVRYLWKSRLADIRFDAKGAVMGVVLANGEELPCDALVLAVGHSARDTFEMLQARGVAMRQKAFAMGVRVEHPQDFIDQAQYGPSKGNPALPPADYKLTCNFGVNRAAYSFCMCPGGEVIQCASEEGGVVVNGMSNAARNSGFANSGLVAKVTPEDFGSEDALAGMRFQRTWEQAAFRAAGERYGAPAMSVQDFIRSKASGRLPATSFRPFAVPADLRTCLPAFVHEQLSGALPIFERKIHGFTSREALLLGIESRTSSPIQLLRGEFGESVSHSGLYPCGEGAGFAGGITSAAVDGIKVAEWIARKAGAPVFLPFEKALRGSELATEY